MEYLVAGHTDIGLNRKVNQDAYSIQVAQTNRGQAVFTVICDGVGGMRCGELSSATVVTAFAEWFEQDFPQCLYEDAWEQSIINDWAQLMDVLNSSIQEYGRCNQLRTGTTAALLLLIEGVALMANIGDSRVYWISSDGEERQISRDQTLAQREYDLGRLSKEQLKTDKRNHILLQCIGSSIKLKIDAARLPYRLGDAFVLCTDGFYRKSEISEFERLVQDAKQEASTESVKAALFRQTELVKSRNESDNITSIAVVAH